MVHHRRAAQERREPEGKRYEPSQNTFLSRKAGS